MMTLRIKTCAEAPHAKWGIFTPLLQRPAAGGQWDLEQGMVIKLVLWDYTEITQQSSITLEDRIHFYPYIHGLHDKNLEPE